jgi:hypothetical protein
MMFIGGYKHSGLTKNTLASTILSEIKKNGIKTERQTKDVIQKFGSCGQEKVSLFLRVRINHGKLTVSLSIG